MGHLTKISSSMIKSLVFFAIIALSTAEAEPSAEAKADPWLLYGGYPYYGHLGLSYYHGVGGYYYGKRSAEAEPTAEAKADPWLLYGGYPYSGHLGYPYIGYW